MTTRLFHILALSFFALPALAQDGAWSPAWKLDEPDTARNSRPIVAQTLEQAPLSLQALGFRPQGSRSPGLRSSRPTLAVTFGSQQRLAPRAESRNFSWSLEAWEMNTASLAHIQCSRATRKIESFVVEDCRFVDQPLPADSTNLVQIRGQWSASPGLSIGSGVFAGRTPVQAPWTLNSGTRRLPALSGSGTEQVEGANVNVSLGVGMGSIGNLLLDLQLERYRSKREFMSGQRITSPLAGESTGIFPSTRYNRAEQVALGWRNEQFSADLSRQHRELPYWVGERLEGEGFRSFDIEFSWNAPARSSISVGVSNVLDRLPGAVSNGADQSMEEAVDGIYGRIPYVRYKHDL